MLPANARIQVPAEDSIKDDLGYGFGGADSDGFLHEGQHECRCHQDDVSQRVASSCPCEDSSLVPPVLEADRYSFEMLESDVK